MAGLFLCPPLKHAPDRQPFFTVDGVLVIGGAGLGAGLDGPQPKS